MDQAPDITLTGRSPEASMARSFAVPIAIR
jgi:hypothetical protein